MNTDEHRCRNLGANPKLRPNILSLSVFICVYLWLIFLSSCTTKPTDLRTLVPAETLVYLETNDLGAALQPIVDSKPFTEVAKSKPDLSALKGVQLAVAVTGFETSEEKLTDEHSVGRVQPHFVAVADTHAWHFQAVAFAEQKLGAFVADMYDSEPTLEKPEKNGGRYLTWTAKDGRKAYAFVMGSVIYFSNDETAIEKCLAVKRGEADSIVKTGKVTPVDPGTLASGYVSTDGIAQIANIVGLKFASEAGEDSEVQSAIAGILPQLLRNSITDIRWTSTKTDQGIEDKYMVSMPSDYASIFNETMAESGKIDFSSLSLPENYVSLSVYDLRDPQVAWRSVLLVAQKQLDPVAGKMIKAISPSFFEPYGVKDSESFLRSVGPGIVTAKFDEDADKHLIIANVKNAGDVLRSLESAFKLTTVEYDNGKMNVLRSADGEFTADISENTLVLGDAETAMRYLGGRHDLAKRQQLIDRLNGTSKACIKTISSDDVTATAVANLLSETKSDDLKANSSSFTETRFTKSGIERRTVSDFGLIGAIIAQLSGD